MNLEIYNTKFNKIKDFEFLVPNISLALEVLINLHEEKKNIILKKNSLSKKPGVMFYDFVDKTFDEYCFDSLNSKLLTVYTEIVVNKKVILYNKLYRIFYNILERLILNNKYDFFEHYDIHHILIKFCHGLRIARRKDITKFFFNEIMNIYYIQYLKIPGEIFYLLMHDFVIDLAKANILSYSFDENAVAFNPVYANDLKQLIFFSFELMFLGENEYINNIVLPSDINYSQLQNFELSYKSDDEILRMLTNDIVVCFVISCSVEKISYNSRLNNLFIENVIFNINKK